MRAVRFEVQKGLEMDESLEEAVLQLTGESALHRKRPDGRYVIPREVMAMQFLKGFATDPAAMVERLDQLGILSEYLPDIKKYRPPSGLPRSLQDRRELLEDGHQQENQHIRTESYPRALEAIRYHHNHPAEEDYPATVDEYLFLLIKDLGKNQELSDYERGGQQHYQKEYLELSAAYLDRLVNETKLDTLSGDHHLKIHLERIKEWLRRHQLAANLLHPHYREQGRLDPSMILPALPELTQDPVWRLFKSEVLTSPTADQRSEQIEWVEQQLHNLEKIVAEKPRERVEQLLSGRDIMQAFFIAQGPDIGRLRQEAGKVYLEQALDLPQEKFDSDQQIKRLLFTQLVAHSHLRKQWQPAKESESGRARQLHLLHTEDLQVFATDQETEEQTTRILLRALENRSAEIYLGENVAEAADHVPGLQTFLEKREGGESFGEHFAFALAKQPNKVLDWLEKGFKNERTFASLIFPEVKAMAGCEQDAKYHAEGDVWTHTKLLFQAAQKKGFDLTPELALALLLHDTGKPETQEHKGERIHFIGHEKVSANQFRQMVERLGMGGSEKIDLADVERAIRDHMILYTKAGAGGIGYLDIREYLPDGTDDLLFKLMSCDATARQPSAGVENSDQKVFTEIAEKAGLIKKEENYPDVFDQLVKSPLIQAVMGQGENTAKQEALYQEFLRGLNEGEIPDAATLQHKFLTKSAKWTSQYVKQVLAPGRLLIDHGLSPGPEIGKIQNEITARLIAGKRMDDKSVSQLIVEQLQVELATETST